MMGNGALRARFWGALASLALLACGGLPPGKYPAVDLGVSDFSVEVSDTRGLTTSTPIDGPADVPEASFKIPFPAATFKTRATQRLDQLERPGGMPLRALVSVKRSEVTYLKDVNGDLVRWSVTLGIQVTSASGKNLARGTVSAWQELPARGSSAADMGAAYTDAALAAFDAYFGSESTLEALRIDLESYRRSHPQ